MKNDENSKSIVNVPLKGLDTFLEKMKEIEKTYVDRPTSKSPFMSKKEAEFWYNYYFYLEHGFKRKDV